jgi:hypothetical protein
MKAHLLYSEADFDWQRPLPWNADALVRDLDLDRLFNAMAREDEFLFKIAKQVVLAGPSETSETILHRQAVVTDCQRRPETIRSLYAIAVEAIEVERKNWLGTLDRYPEYVLRRSIELMEAFLALLRQVREIADTHGDGFVSPGGAELFASLKRDLPDDYLDAVHGHLQQMKFAHGLSLSGELGPGNTPTGYVLRTPPLRRRWLARLFPPGPPVYRFEIHPRDEPGARALSELRGRGISSIALALARAAEHVVSFFRMLRAELAFYVGCLNLHQRLAGFGAPVCLPSPAAPAARRLAFEGLYDVTLALNLRGPAVGNIVNADGRDLIVVTGANQGGKSTFLRSVGLAQLMMQCGMFVPAQTFAASLCDGLITHYKREEDAGMDSGKLDEELKRMSDIVDHLTPHPMVLFNESFAATNEREGSELSRQILTALLERGVRILTVTHLYELARQLASPSVANPSLFLRAERNEDGTRSFRLVEGAPLETSFGEDLYNSIFKPSERQAAGRPDVRAPVAGAPS